MESSTNRLGLVIALHETVMPGLARLAIRRGWQVVQAALPRQVLPVVLRQPAQMLVVQVSVPVEEAVELIRLLRTIPRRVPILAVAASHDRWVEQAAREAGASCYLPDCDTLDVLQQAIDSMLPQRTSS